MKNWLITGGCGFIGTRLISLLVKDEANRICVVDNLSVGDRGDLANVASFIELTGANYDGVFDYPGDKQCSLVVGDILDEDLALALTKNADVIVHLAANTGVGPSVENPRNDCRTNVLGTFNYLEGARQRDRCRFIFASSGAPLGEVSKLPIHENLPSNPVSPYGASKLAGEGYCSAYSSSFGVETVALRFGNVYGPGSLHKNSVVAKFIRQAIDGEDLDVYGSGKQTRDFIYIDDLIDAVLAAASKPNVGGEKFQIATNEESTVGELVEMLVKVLESVGVEGINVVHSEARTGDVMRNFSDIGKAKKMLGWEPKYTLSDGLVKTVSYFKNQGKTKNA